MGDPNPPLFGSLTGLKNSETQAAVSTGTLVFSTTADIASIEGNYPINGGGLTVTSGNYEAAINQDAGNARRA